VFLEPATLIIRRTINFTDVKEDILTYEVSDQAVEAASGLLEDKAANITLSFCSGLDICPS
jgi:hypothetical protein